MRSMRFVHESHAQRVHFAPGSAAPALEGEVERLGARRVMVIASPSAGAVADRICAGLPVALRHDEVVMHVPTEVAERARRAAAGARADAVVSVGGGSATGLAKAVALTTGLPVVAVPTTYAGSEATAVWGTKEGSRKTTGTDPRVLPVAVVYDARLTLSLPVAMSVASGLNAVAHCVDSMWSPGSDPIDRALATEGLAALAGGLPLLAAEPRGLKGRELVLYGAYVAAVAFSSAGSGLHHKICHVLAGAYRLPHAQTHAVVLPHVLALNAPYAPEAETRLARAFESGSSLTGLGELRRVVRAPKSLRGLGFARADIPAAADLILPVAPPDNPAPVTRAVLERLLTAAWKGDDLA